MPEPAAPRARRLRLVLGLAALAILLLALALYASRRTLAREALTGWLRARGIASEAQVQAIGPTTFVASLRIGDPARPDFSAERAEVRYRLTGLRMEVTAVELERPVLRASLRGGRLSLGALDPLIEELRKRPPRPDARKPQITIEDGVALLSTDYGPLRLTADAAVNDGRLTRLSARSDAVRLEGPSLKGDLGAATLRTTSRADRADLLLDAPFSGALGGATLTGARLRLAAAGPYPDLERRRGEGDLTVRGELTAGRAEVGAERIEDAKITFGLRGRTTGWVDTLSLTGRGEAQLTTAKASARTGGAGRLQVALDAPDLRWTRAGGDRASTAIRASAIAQDVAAADLRLAQANLSAAGRVAITDQGASLDLTGSAAGQGAWTGLGPATAADSPEIAALKRGLQNFRLTAPGLAVRAEGSDLRLFARAPIRLEPVRGGRLEVAALGGQPLLGPGGGALQLQVGGGGLPQVDAAVTRLTLNDGLTARGRGRLALGLGPIVGGRFGAAGVLRVREGISFEASECVDVQADRLEFGENDIEGLAGRLCPTGGPVLTLRGGDWRIRGAARGVSAAAPFLQARVEDASGAVTMGARGGRLDAVLKVEQARVVDAAPEMRFNPLRMTGDIALADDLWRGGLRFATPAGQPLASATLRHEGLSGLGGVQIDTGALAFAEGGLQPAELSPLAAALGSPATGQVRFEGGFDWTPTGVTSGGRLDIARLDFQSPAGRVTGLSGQVALTSLAPLVAAPGQVLRAEGVQAFAPLTGVSATFELQEKALLLSGGEATVGGGRVRVETLEIPLEPNAPTKGVLLFEGVQLHDLVEASPFGDKVEMWAKVSGRVPFEAVGQRVRITGGELRAIEPGRLSIRREALTGIAAEGAVEAPPGAPAPPVRSDTFTDFAYQAMENLAFQQLSAVIDSRPDGRLGVLFMIQGRHDPPQRQEIRLGLLELLQRRFMERQLPLPSGTEVNLTLDTTLNLDDLLRDYAEYQRLRGSDSVQTPP